MATAIKHISVQRGRDVTQYTFTCFGGAAGQHAGLVADELGLTLSTQAPKRAIGGDSQFARALSPIPEARAPRS